MESGISLFPDAKVDPLVADMYAEDILKPSGRVKFRTFLQRRKRLGAFSIGLASMHIILTP